MEDNMLDAAYEARTEIADTQEWPGNDVSEFEGEPEEEEEEGSDEPWDGFNSDAEADGDALASAGWGTNEDYGDYGGDE